MIEDFGGLPPLVLLIGPILFTVALVPMAVAAVIGGLAAQQAVKAARSWRRPALEHISDALLEQQPVRDWPCGWPPLVSAETNTEVRCRAYARLARGVGRNHDLLSEFCLLTAGAALGVTLPRFFDGQWWAAVAGLALAPAAACVALRQSAATWRRRASLFDRRARQLATSQPPSL